MESVYCAVRAECLNMIRLFLAYSTARSLHFSLSRVVPLARPHCLQCLTCGLSAMHASRTEEMRYAYGIMTGKPLGRLIIDEMGGQ